MGENLEMDIWLPPLRLIPNPVESEVLSREVRDSDVALAMDSLEPPEDANILEDQAEFVRSGKILLDDIPLLDD
ncbi:hypothetical protein P3T76_000902 [Phytophthora citrophthora]|uniref:Uncharacterized protein n=1 Tax=Phytophthora citrophthora TaxID=4793 RepID=A0AAD9GY56_9STRA|nr:hypothetical protein P3T76_000902 [Phytophthora citrophthora]